MLLEIHKKMASFSTRLGNLQGLPVFVSDDMSERQWKLSRLDYCAFFIYWSNEIRYAVCSSHSHDGSVEALKGLIKDYPNSEVIVYTREYLEMYLDFSPVVKKMKVLTKSYNRDIKINELLKK